MAIISPERARVFSVGSCLQTSGAGNSVFRNTTNNPIGIGNVWTCAGWVKGIGHGNSDIWLNVKATGGFANEILVQTPSSGATNTLDLNVTLKNNATTTFKNYTWLNFWTPGCSWVHWALTWDGTSLIGYRNGKAITPDTLTTDNADSMANTNRQVSIAGIPTGSGVTYARFSDYAIWSVALSAAEVAQVWAAAGNLDYRSIQGENLQHWWPLNGLSFAELGTDYGNASTTIDLSANAINTNTRIVKDAPQINQLAPIPYFPGHTSCLYFDGNAAQVIGSTTSFGGFSSDDLGFGNAWSIMAWIKPDETAPTVTRVIWEMGTGGPSKVFLTWQGTIANDPIDIATTTTANGNLKGYRWNSSLFNNLGPNAWNQFICTWDGTNLLGYINGVLTSPSTTPVNASGVMDRRPRNCIFGADTSINNNYLGKIYQTAVWARALTQAEVTAAYGGGSVAKLDLRAAVPLPLHWWLFGYKEKLGDPQDRGVVDLVDSENSIDSWNQPGTAGVSVSNIQTDYPGITT